MAITKKTILPGVSGACDHERRYLAVCTMATINTPVSKSSVLRVEAHRLGSSFKDWREIGRGMNKSVTTVRQIYLEFEIGRIEEPPRLRKKCPMNREPARKFDECVLEYDFSIFQ